jgi:hypothetical protein
MKSPVGRIPETTPVRGAAMNLRTRLLMLRTRVLLRRANRRRRRALAAELAGYVTDAQRDDLFAVLDRYPDGQTEEIRDMLFQQRIRALRCDGGSFTRS